MVSNFFSRKSYIYEVMRKNILHTDRSQIIIRRMRIACWIPKATTHTQNMWYLLFSTATMFARTHLSVTLYIHCLPCLFEHYYLVRLSCGEGFYSLWGKKWMSFSLIALYECSRSKYPKRPAICHLIVCYWFSYWPLRNSKLLLHDSSAALQIIRFNISQ
jgi:hypothetical protein